MMFTGCIKNGKNTAPRPLPLPGQPALPPGLIQAYPDFVAGAGYVIPGAFVEDLYLASLKTRLLPVEDAFTTGYCAKRIGLHPPLHDERFSCGQMVTNQCSMKHMFTGHKVTPSMQVEIMEKMKNGQCGP